MTQMVYPELPKAAGAGRILSEKVSDADSAAARMKDLPETERPREKLLASCAEALTDAELVAILLRTGISGCNVRDLAERFLKGIGGLDNIRTWDSRSLKLFISRTPELRGIGKDKIASLLAAFEVGFRIYAVKQDKPAAAILTPSQAVALVIDEIKHFNREGFWVLYLDRRRRLIDRPELLTLGVGARTVIDVQTVFRQAVLMSAAAVILIHNHPSGHPDPSPEDLATTDTLIAAGKTLNIPVIDHIIVGRPGVCDPCYYSIRSHQQCHFN
ncbi:MAG: DNA repair protein RadC [Kiritimatiellae bacterium]|nr:DNA repair protein RadC [Kiritimatiellia bacterium]